MRPIHFVKYYDKGSTILAGDQIAAGLRARGLESRCLYPADLGSCRDALLVFIKTSKLHHLLAARARRNALVLDLCDTPVFKRRIKSWRLFDGMIFKSPLQRRDFGRAGRRDASILHQWDPRYRRHEAGEDELRLCYLGDRRSITFWGEIPEIAYIDHDYFERAVGFNCHLNVRLPGRDADYKPASKITTAAGCGAVVITTPDSGSVELLGEDYPYYTGHRREEIAATIRHAAATIGGAEWRAAMERIEAVRESTRIERVLDDYEAYLRLFE